MTPENWEKRESWADKKKKWFWKKAIRCAEILAILAALWYWVYKYWEHDIKKANDRKKADTEQYWNFKVTPDGATYEFGDNLDGGPDPDSLVNLPLDTLLEYNSDIVGVNASTLVSIMLQEEALKTDKKFLKIFDLQKLDSLLIDNWVDRNTSSESVTGKLLGRLKEWSYWPFQVQPEAIDKYKNDSVYDVLCKRIANFRLPDKQWNIVPLHEQLWLSLEEMVEKIKNHDIYTFIWGERFLVAYWIVLIDQIAREVDEKINLYNWKTWYDTRTNNTSDVEKSHPILVSKKENDIMSPYILLNRWEVPYNTIWTLLNSDAFRSGMIAAYRCMDYKTNIQNSDYLFMLNLLELNEWFNNPTWDLNVITPTWRFWPSTVKLVNKHFGKNFDPDSDKGRAEAKEFMDNLGPKELKKLKDAALDNFEKNMRLLYTLNPDDKYWVNSIQEKYLSECLDITFNHMYVWFTMFQKFINNNCPDKLGEANELWNKFIEDQDKTSLENLKRIMTNEEAFVSFTWLDRQEYLHLIKYYIGPAIIWWTDRVSQTWWIIPVIQDHEWWEWSRSEEWVVNESNSVSRFDIWVTQEQIAQQLREQWIEYVLQPWDANIDSLKQIMWDRKPVREYLQKCKTINWEPITSSQDIPDELANLMLWWTDWTNPLFENWEWFYEWDTIYIRHIGLDGIWHKIKVDKPVTKTVNEKVKIWKKQKTITKTKTLCTVNSDGTLTMQEWWTFLEVLYTLSKENPEIKKMLESIKWWEINRQRDITGDIIKKVVRNPDWTSWPYIDRVVPGQKFIIVLPINY